MKKTILLLTVVSLLVVGIAFAKPPGSLGPPDLLSITPGTATIDEVDDVPVLLLDWTIVDGAEKYSVDVEATATYETGEIDPVTELPITATVEVSASFGTSDRLDGGDMSDSDLNIPVSDIEALLVELEAALEAALIAAELPLDTPAVVEVWAKVKALDPHFKPNKRQNNPFSVPLEIELPIVIP